MNCICPLSQMFGFSTELRGLTQGQGEYGMEYKTHEPVMPDEVAKIIKDIKKRRKSLN
jgi:elongation factor G